MITDEFHKAQRPMRISFLKNEIEKIETGITKASNPQILKDVLAQYKAELAQLEKNTQGEQNV